jgi:RNase adaptor protein for sRNA GlmZ degradation
LILTSHGYSPPLNPPPDLRVDVRNLPNPPKHIRDAYNGTSKRLQEWMKENPVFIARRDAIRTEIETAMTKKMDEHEKKDVLKVEPKNNVKDIQAQSLPTGKNSGVEELDEAIDRNEDEDEDADSSSAADVDDDSRDDGITLKVGIFCAMGRHRSVAMVEELVRMSWPGWHLRVEHRDIAKKRGQGKKAGGRDKKSRGTRGGPSSYKDDDYE